MRGIKNKPQDGFTSRPYQNTKGTKNMFEEIRNNYMWGPAVEPASNFDDEGDILCVISIDGWERGNEQGSTLANVILTLHGDVVCDWHNNGARMNDEVRKAIREAKDELKPIWANYQDSLKRNQAKT